MCLGNIFALKMSQFRIHLKAGGHFKGRQTQKFQKWTSFNTQMWKGLCSGWTGFNTAMWKKEK